MTKVPTQWKTKDGYDSVTAGNQDLTLLLEDGDDLLLEDGDTMLLEDTLITPKAPTVWAEN